MSETQNPFTPTFGAVPPVVVGRKSILNEIKEAYASPVGNGYSSVSLIAHRGAGKTVLLNEIQDLANDAGWLVIQEDAGDDTGLLQERLVLRLQDFIDSRTEHSTRRITGGSASILGVGVGISTTAPVAPQPPPNLRRTMETIFRMGNDAPAGILLSVDEVHAATKEEIATLGNAVQHLHRDAQPVATALAGLPVLESNQPTFLARSTPIEMSMLSDADIELGLVRTALVAGVTFIDEALELAVEAAAGYPYMMQLVGWHSCRSAMRRAADVVTHQDVSSTLNAARKRLKTTVLSRIGYALTDVERVFLAAMALDEGPTKTKMLQQRLGKSPQLVNEYRVRLLDSGLICQVERGVYDFVIPGHRAEMRGSEEYQIFQDIEAERAARIRNRPSPGRGLER